MFRNAQWIVADSGIHSREPYDLLTINMTEIDRISTVQGMRYYDWPQRASGIEWVVIDLFNEAFEFALRYHAERTGRHVDGPKLMRSLKLALVPAM